MRLINTTTYERCERSEIEHSQGYKTPVKYAILSHRWCDHELSFAAYRPELLRTTDAPPHISKIIGACQRALAEQDPLHWIWIDNVCIDKSSSTEFSEAINSMFVWYRDAEICYAYLQDTTESILQPSGEPSEWCSRGWTLQELIAPTKMRFYDKSWTDLGTRAQLAPRLESVTRIAARYLDGREDFRSASIAARLSWQAPRRTTRVEDMTYSLLGVLGVSLDIRYGEGPEAFMRLQNELFQSLSTSDESLFAWTMPPKGLPLHSRSDDWQPDQWGLLAPTPQCFYDSTDIIAGRRFRRRPPSDIRRTGDGIVFPMPRYELWSSVHDAMRVFGFLFLGLPVTMAYALHVNRKEFPIALNCWASDKNGVLQPIGIVLTRDGSGDNYWRRTRCSRLGLYPHRSHLRSEMETSLITILQPANVRWPSRD